MMSDTFFSYIHSYLKYANIAWESPYQIKLKTIHYHQKHAEWTVFNKDKITHSRPLLGLIYDSVFLMQKVSRKLAQVIFTHSFPTHSFSIS